MQEENNAIRRIRTTMIGAIAAVEKYFADEISNDESFREKFNCARKEILDLGNKQIRNLKEEGQ